VIRPRALAAAALTAAVALGAPTASAKKMDIGFADGLYRSANAETREKWFDNSRRAGASIARIDAYWREIAPTKPLLPTNPNDVAYKWGTLDAAVADANAAGLEPLLTVSLAPNWAEGPGREGSAPPGTWKPDDEEFGDFARALAARYGSQVRYYQAWNEQNISGFLNPQYEGGNLVAPDIYRRLLNSFYAGITDVDATSKVITGGTAPYGEPPGGRRTRPLVFIRDLLCLNGQNEPTGNCNSKAKFDALSHHPINTSGGPKTSAVHPDDVSTPDVKHVVKALRRAEDAGTPATGGRHEVWLTEFWWETNPPDRCTGVNVRKHADWIAQALRSFERQGASVAINFLIRDHKYNQDSGCGRTTFQTGAFFDNGKKKPAFAAFKNYAR
jgi:hypothetical protein